MQTINGLEISKDIASAWAYAEKVLGMSEEEFDLFCEEKEEAYDLLSRLIALVYAHKLLRNTSHICGSLVDATNQMITEIGNELQEKYAIEFQFNHFNWY